MNYKKIIMISSALITFLMLSQFNVAYSYQTNTYNRIPYGNQYNYNYNNNYNFNYNNYYNYINPYPKSGAYNYVTGSNYATRNPVLLGINRCGTRRCNKISYTNSLSHFFIRNKEDYQYYTHPELLAPRRMSNNQRWYPGTHIYMRW